MHSSSTNLRTALAAASGFTAHILSYHSRPVPPLPSTAAELAERLLAGEKRALARAISLVENDDPEGWALVREVFPKTGRAAVVGFTGPPAAAKRPRIGRSAKSRPPRGGRAGA